MNRIGESRRLNENFNNIIDKKGINHLTKSFEKALKESKYETINTSFKCFCKDLNNYKKIASKIEYSYIQEFNKKRHETIIFKIESDDVNYHINDAILPFDNLYISTNYHIQDENEFIGIGGFHIRNEDDVLTISFVASRLINDGWWVQTLTIDKDVFLDRILLKNEKIKTLTCFFDKNDIKPSSFDSDIVNKSAMYKKYIADIAIIEFIRLFKKLLYKINKNEFTTYEKYERGEMVTKNIVFAHSVKRHRRHFWSKTGYFKIPEMGKENWEKMGYKTHEVFHHNGHLEHNIPYVEIDPFNTSGKIQKENQSRDLLEVKIFRNESKLGEIIRKIYPDTYIKKHDRKKLKGLELDFFLPELNIAFEYDGEQHFDQDLCENVFGSNFKDLQKRDRKKDIKCRDLGIMLIRVKYDEPLQINHIKRKIKEKLK